MKKFNLIDRYKIMQNVTASEYICVSRAHITLSHSHNASPYEFDSIKI